MQEIELKCRFSPAQLPALRQALDDWARAQGQPGPQTQRLQAAYVDTPGRALAAARAALRLRREPAGWVQTLKALGPTTLQRLEHNAPVPGAAGKAEALPPLRLDRHAGTPAAAALAAALGLSPADFDLRAARGDTLDLAPTFETDITRLCLAWTPPDAPAGTCIELALDEGEVRAGSHREPLLELEFELLAGPVSALVEAVVQACAPFGLWLDTRSKAERGERLSRGLGLPAPQAVPLPQWRSGGPDPTDADALAAGGHAALRQAVRQVLNPLLGLHSLVADPLAAAPGGGLLPAHVRHWHRGLGALHQALAQAAEPALLGWNLPPAPGLDPAWAEALMAQLGPLDAMAPDSAQAAQAAGRVARSPALQAPLLRTLGWLATG
ncbi:CYTH domain-containing protein [Ideonella livida]|uniref:CYTH domain-containing protein n=1 Tax=Ideonella livida TaxID=2707176 RepID=A0A7C9PI55_9BURK|nr:CYTH domain-containing protein [Ideonella livida]NDY92409.1 CYTH domain-containing protein [Ideonella livida]